MSSDALSQDRYLSLYLDEADLPELSLAQDSRLYQPDAGDDSFGRNNGLFTGMCVWVGSNDTIVQRLVDIRFAFASTRDATAYHRERLRANAESLPPVPGAPAVGSACAVFGGVKPSPLSPDLLLTAYLYVFRVGRVLVKLFAMQSTSFPPNTLSPEDLAAIARRIEARIGNHDPGIA